MLYNSTIRQKLEIKLPLAATRWRQVGTGRNVTVTVTQYDHTYGNRNQLFLMCTTAHDVNKLTYFSGLTTVAVYGVVPERVDLRHCAMFEVAWHMKWRSSALSPLSFTPRGIIGTYDDCLWSRPHYPRDVKESGKCISREGSCVRKDLSTHRLNKPASGACVRSTACGCRRNGPLCPLFPNALKLDTLRFAVVRTDLDGARTTVMRVLGAPSTAFSILNT